MASSGALTKGLSACSTHSSHWVRPRSAPPGIRRTSPSWRNSNPSAGLPGSFLDRRVHSRGAPVRRRCARQMHATASIHPRERSSHLCPTRSMCGHAVAKGAHATWVNTSSEAAVEPARPICGRPEPSADALRELQAHNAGRPVVRASSSTLASLLGDMRVDLLVRGRAGGVGMRPFAAWRITATWAQVRSRKRRAAIPRRESVTARSVAARITRAGACRAGRCPHHPLLATPASGMSRRAVSRHAEPDACTSPRRGPAPGFSPWRTRRRPPGDKRRRVAAAHRLTP